MYLQVLCRSWFFLYKRWLFLSQYGRIIRSGTACLAQAITGVSAEIENWTIGNKIWRKSKMRHFSFKKMHFKKQNCGHFLSTQCVKIPKRSPGKIRVLFPGNILCMCSANERRRYNVTSSHIGCACTVRCAYFYLFYISKKLITMTSDEHQCVRNHDKLTVCSTACSDWQEWHRQVSALLAFGERNPFRKVRDYIYGECQYKVLGNV